MGKKYFDLGSFKKDCGKTSSELAKLLNISHSNMSRYDNESGAMPIKYVLELCNIFNAELSDYLKDILETDIEIATFTSLSNVLSIVEEAGSSIEKIAKVNVFVKNIEDFDKINKIYADLFKDHKPARALVEVSRLPKNSVIEIEAIATL